MKTRNLGLATSIAILTAIPILSQLITGSISGTVVDSSGAAIANARILLTK